LRFGVPEAARVKHFSMAGNVVGFWQRFVHPKTKNPLRDKDVTASIEVKS
jgi:hypothetical protein